MSCQTPLSELSTREQKKHWQGQKRTVQADLPAGGAGAGVLGCVSPGVEGVGVFGEGDPG